MMAAKGSQIGIRLTGELREKLEEAASRSGWSLSQQVRFQLEDDFGLARTPYLPHGPSSDGPSRKRRRAA